LERRQIIKSNLSTLIAAIITYGMSTAAFSQNSCVALLKGPIYFDVSNCKAFDPKMFNPSNPKYKFIGDLDPAGRQQLLNSYRGLVLKGKVSMSQASHDGVSSSKGSMQGQTTFVFVPPNITTCETILNKRINGELNEKCCNGTGDSPCLLGTGLTLTNVKVIGTAASDQTILKAKAPEKSRGKDYTEAEKLFAEKKYKEAAALYEKAEAAKDIDLRGLYRLGYSYREQELCDKAIRPLKRIWQTVEAKKVWSEDETYARQGMFLLARCHAKSGSPSEAIFYLNAFLLDPKKYRDELQATLKHKDFGWIHTSKEYQQFKRDAQSKLNSNTP
jgi:hypothetical protein